MIRNAGTTQGLLEQAPKEIEKLRSEEKEESKHDRIEQPEKRSNEAEAKVEIEAHLRDFSPLHASLATYFCEFVQDVSYRKLEKRLLLLVQEKKEQGEGLTIEETDLLNKVRFCFRCGTKNPRGSVRRRTAGAIPP